jgi:hypothetical protein
VSGSPSTDITCEEADALLPLVADGALDAEQDPPLFAHLARCSACQEALARHDLVALALARDGVGAASERNIRIRLPLPWAIASAACLGMGVTAAWSYARAERAEADFAARLAALPPSDDPIDREVIVGGQDQHPVYVMLPDGQTVMLAPRDPQRSKPVRSPLVRQVGLSRY